MNFSYIDNQNLYNKLRVVCDKYIPIFTEQITSVRTYNSNYSLINKNIKKKEITIDIDLMDYRSSEKIPCKVNGWDIETIPVLSFDPLNYLSAKITLNLKCEEEGNFNISGKITCLPNCCGIAVISNIDNNINTNQGLGTLFFEFLKELCKVNKYTIIIATDRESGYGTKILNKTAKKVVSFRNKRSLNMVNLFVENLDKDDKEFNINIEEA